ncbi:hypothetical protein COCMIDRAFT_6967 [Bipolaris oryzae ATCC 44560]|uniref:Uncharacterized protein n=1 Tax=Bipolaris oryzae ATCC 44560 TaxID=930090 RepID=W6ZJ21_COCMI|nr:uncharacterized protein COCMIDRAFT_6967 [Bipolaris oryzae ATCC 44560]EUC43591.1 hypothetical protein COCMIDRAFT_6967 [Bipolaris oryzae ATCC 44560]
MYYGTGRTITQTTPSIGCVIRVSVPKSRVVVLRWYWSSRLAFRIKDMAEYLRESPGKPPKNKSLFGRAGDIWSTARQGLAWSKFEPSDTTAVWSPGPIGLLTAYSARLRGASKDVIVDRVQQRLQRAQSFGAIPINFEAQNITAIIQSQVPWGIMRQVECVGLEAFDPGLTYNPSYIWNQRLGIAHYGDGVGFLALWGHTSVITPLAPRADLIPTNVSLPYTQSWLERVSLSGGVVVPSQTAGHLIKIIGSGVARSIGDPSMTVDIGIEKVPEYYARFGRLEITIYINVL